MKQYVIIEKLKEIISENDRKVIASIFYTYQFDAKFFENYILTTFLPNVNFSDHEIQNTILWRKYAIDLPPVTVYCDFHAKGSEAPNINYTVRTIDLPTIDGKKACFHPKVSFILLDDWSLIVLNGSNNLTEGGWCKNREIVSIKELKNGKFFPYYQKHQLWGFLKDTNKLSGQEYSDAESNVHGFFAQRKYTDYSDFQFYHSYRGAFSSFLEKILEENEEVLFEYIEIISPYLSPELNLIKELKEMVNADNIFINTPYKASNEADITKQNYYAYENEGIKWSKFRDKEEEKGFRFNHSKIYRLKTSQNLFTIIGSVNFTQAAWRGRNKNGNLETAIVIKEPIAKWESWLEEYYNKDIIFSSEQGDETNHDGRFDAPDLQFELDWREKTLKYRNLVKFSFNGRIVFSSRNIELKTKINSINLDEKIIDELANNPTIRVKQFFTQKEFFYFPIQKGYESKPLPQKLRLKDNELIELWEHVSIKEKKKSEISELIEKFILSKLDKEGSIKADSKHVKSTLNMMASHISALIRLNSRIFKTPRLKRDNKSAKNLLDYYLFMSNIDTLTGYRNLLQEMYEKKLLLPGVYWFLLNLLVIDFYNISKIRKFYSAINESYDGLKARVDGIINSINNSSLMLRKELKEDGVNMELLKWIKANIKT